MMRVATISLCALCGLLVASCRQQLQPEKRTFRGQVFVTLQSRETIKLSLVPILLVESNAAAICLAQARTIAEAEQDRKNQLHKDELARLGRDVERLNSEYHTMVLNEHAIQISTRDADNKIAQIQTDVNARSRLKRISAPELNAARETILQLKAIADSNDVVLADLKTWKPLKSADVDRARKSLEAFQTGKVPAINIAEKLWGAVWPNKAKTITDADGKFALETDSTTNFVAIAFAKRKLLDGEEAMFWFVPLNDSEVNLLHNGNLTADRNRISK